MMHNCVPQSCIPDELKKHNFPSFSFTPFSHKTLHLLQIQLLCIKSIILLNYLCVFCIPIIKSAKFIYLFFVSHTVIVSCFSQFCMSFFFVVVVGYLYFKVLSMMTLKFLSLISRFWCIKIESSSGISNFVSLAKLEIFGIIVGFEQCLIVILNVVFACRFRIM